MSEWEAIYCIDVIAAGSGAADQIVGILIKISKYGVDTIIQLLLASWINAMVLGQFVISTVQP